MNGSTILAMLDSDTSFKFFQVTDFVLKNIGRVSLFTHPHDMVPHGMNGWQWISLKK